MIRNILYTCLAMAALHCLPSRAAESDSLRMEWTDSTKLALDFMLTPGDVKVKTNYRLIMTPRIVGENGGSEDDALCALIAAAAEKLCGGEGAANSRGDGQQTDEDMPAN